MVEMVQRWRLDHVLQLYHQGQITKARAAELAGVSLYEILDILRQRGTVSQYSLDELREDLARLLPAA